MAQGLLVLRASHWTPEPCLAQVKGEQSRYKRGRPNEDGRGVTLVWWEMAVNLSALLLDHHDFRSPNWTWGRLRSSLELWSGNPSGRTPGRALLTTLQMLSQELGKQLRLLTWKKG